MLRQHLTARPSRSARACLSANLHRSRRTCHWIPPQPACSCVHLGHTKPVRCSQVHLNPLTVAVASRRLSQDTSSPPKPAPSSAVRQGRTCSPVCGLRQARGVLLRRPTAQVGQPVQCVPATPLLSSKTRSTCSLPNMQLLPLQSQHPSPEGGTHRAG